MDIYNQTVSNRAIVAATAQTVVQLVAASTCRPQLTGLTVCFDGGLSTAEPADVYLVQQTGAGTSSAGTIGKTDTSAPAAISATRVSFTAEPASDDAEIWRLMEHP